MTININKKNIFYTTIFLCSILFCTAILSVALYYIAFLILLVINTNSAKIRIVDHRLRLILFSILSILVISIIHIITVADFITEIKQVVNRIFFLLNFILLIQVYRDEEANRVTGKIIFIFIIALFAYSVFEIFSKVYGFPNLSNYILNNPSFPREVKIKPYSLDDIRLYLLWSEPSFSSYVVIGLWIYVILNKYIYSSVQYRLILLLLSLLIILTFARSAIIPVVLILFFHNLLKYRQIHIFFTKYQVLAYLTVFIIVSYLQYIFLSRDPGSSFDFSFISRSNSMIIGYKIFLDNFISGIGYNNFASFSRYYSTDFPMYLDATVSLSSPSAILSESGLLGLFPLSFLLFYVCGGRSDIRNKLFVIVYIFSYGFFSLDVLYLPVTYFLITILLNSRSVWEAKQNTYVFREHIKCQN